MLESNSCSIKIILLTLQVNGRGDYWVILHTHKNTIRSLSHLGDKPMFAAQLWSQIFEPAMQYQSTPYSAPVALTTLGSRAPATGPSRRHRSSPRSLPLTVTSCSGWWCHSCRSCCGDTAFCIGDLTHHSASWCGRGGGCRWCAGGRRQRLYGMRCSRRGV